MRNWKVSFLLPVPLVTLRLPLFGARLRQQDLALAKCLDGFEPCLSLTHSRTRVIRPDTYCFADLSSNGVKKLRILLLMALRTMHRSQCSHCSHCSHYSHCSHCSRCPHCSQWSPSWVHPWVHRVHPWVHPWVYPWVHPWVHLSVDLDNEV